MGYAWLAPTLARPQRGRERIALTPALSHKWEREYTQAMVRQVVGMHWVSPTLALPQRGREKRALLSLKSKKNLQTFAPRLFPLPFTGEGQGEGTKETPLKAAATSAAQWSLLGVAGKAVDGRT